MSKPLIDLQEEFPDLDSFHVSNKDDNYYYCWLNKKPEHLERNKAMFGYEILGSKHTENALVPPNAVGERVLGDVVLARMPRERYERLQRLRKLKAANQVTAANEAWKDEAAKSGLIPEDTTKSESKSFVLGGN